MKIKSVSAQEPVGIIVLSVDYEKAQQKLVYNEQCDTFKLRLSLWKDSIPVSLCSP